MTPTTINEFLGRVSEVILNPLIILAFAVALISFFWGLVEFIRSADSSDGREQGRRTMIWGIAGMVIMVGVYGIIRIILDTFGLDTPTYIEPML